MHLARRNSSRYLSPKTAFPITRGAIAPDPSLADVTWLRFGGPADWLFQPADEQDLADFLSLPDPVIPIFPMGEGSNLILRDGGKRVVVIRLGWGFNAVTVEGNRVTAGAGGAGCSDKGPKQGLRELGD